MNSESTANIWPTACAGGRRKSSRASSAGAAKGTCRRTGRSTSAARRSRRSIGRSPSILRRTVPSRWRNCWRRRKGSGWHAWTGCRRSKKCSSPRRNRAGVWRLADGWKGFLVQRGEDLDAAVRLRALVGEEASRYQVLRPENPVPVADGVVVGMGLHDELSGEMFAAIKTAAGQGYYVRLPPQAAEKLQERDAVRVGFEVEPWLKPADRIVAQFAQENGGIYDPVRHQRELEGLRAITGRRSSADPGRARGGECPAARTARALSPGDALAGWALADSGRPFEPARKPRADASAASISIRKNRRPDTRACSTAGTGCCFGTGGARSCAEQGAWPRLRCRAGGIPGSRDSRALRRRPVVSTCGSSTTARGNSR